LRRVIIIVMGVTGCGKTTLGEALARRLGLPFQDGDDYHPPANREKLRNNIPLDDNDRMPWLELLSRKLTEWSKEGGAVLACSALKERYRVVLRRGAPDAQFVYIRGDRDVIARRLRLRAEVHDLIKRDFTAILDGQFRDLEEPSDAVVVSCLDTPEKMADDAVLALNRRRENLPAR
jgi:gluconokinase